MTSECFIKQFLLSFLLKVNHISNYLSGLILLCINSGEKKHTNSKYARTFFEKKTILTFIDP